MHRCQCNEGMCGPECSLFDPCQDNELSPCMNGAMCLETCTAFADYKCQCLEGFSGKNCSELVRNLTNAFCKRNTKKCSVSFIKNNCYFQIDSFHFQALLRSSTTTTDILIIVIPIVVALLAICGVVLTTFLVMARNKRATRGTYSPSAQEYCNPRLEMDNVLKPPPEERLI
jgi:hypothetical protein